MNHLDEKSIIDLKSSYQDLFFKNLKVEFIKDEFVVNFDDQWLKLRESELSDLAGNTNNNLITSVNTYYFDRLDYERKNIINKFFSIKPVIKITETVNSVKENIKRKINKSNNLFYEKARSVIRKARTSIILQRLRMLVSFPIRFTLTFFIVTALLGITIKYRSGLMIYTKTEFPLFASMVNDIIAIIEYQFDISISQIILPYYWIIVTALALVSVILIKNIFKPFIRYRRTVASIISTKNQAESEIADLILIDLKKDIETEVHCIYKESFLNALNDYCEQINICLSQVRNPLVDMLHEFKKSSEYMVGSYSPGKVASSCGSSIFSHGFASDIITMVSNKQISNQQLNEVIEQQIQKNIPLIDRKVKEAVNNDVHSMLNNYFDMISKQGHNVSEIGGISLKGFEQQLSSRLNIPMASVSVSSISSTDVNIISNAIIGAGAIGGAMLAGGAGVALIASGPIGLIAGAIIGGNILLGNKDGISNFVKKIFGGDPSEKLKNHFKTIEQNLISDIEKKIEPAYKNINKTLNDITRDYIDAVIKEVSIKNIVYIENR